MNGLLDIFEKRDHDYFYFHFNYFNSIQRQKYVEHYFAYLHFRFSIGSTY